MALEIRRVVTGHDATGKAIVTIDDLAPVVPRAPGIMGALLWTSEGFPVDNDALIEDGTAGREGIGNTIPNGTVFRIVEIEPGNAPVMHRTESIDYAIVLTGALEMELDDGAITHLEAGDVVVQRGTLHSWANRGTVPCRVAFVLIDAKPAEVGGQVLHAARL